MKRRKINWSNFRKMREARKINLAVKFAKSAMDKGIDRSGAMRLAKNLYRVNPHNLRVVMIKQNYK